jgi:hypothetical protein
MYFDKFAKKKFYAKWYSNDASLLIFHGKEKVEIVENISSIFE